MNAITFCPTSCQLKLAICRQRKSNFGFAVPAIHRRKVKFVLLTVRGSAVDGNGLEQRSVENSSWVNVNSPADGFAGWANGGMERRTDDSRKKKSLLGMLGTGVAALIIFSGVTFFIVSLSRRGTSRVKDPMLPLTPQQEEALPSIDNQHQTGGDSDTAVTISGSEESEASSDKDLAFSESGKEDDADASFENSDNLVNSNQEESNQSLVSSNPDDKPHMTDADNSVASQDMQTSSDSVLSQNPGELESSNNLESVNGHPNGVTNLSEVERSNISSYPSDTTPASDLEARNEVADFEYDKTPVEQKLSEDLQESAYQSEEQVLEYDSNDLAAPLSLFGHSGFVKFSPLAGIPAPCAVSATLEMQPGNILVPATVDELQSQALSALKILKVIEDDVKPGDLCTRREYARWLVLASSVLSRSVSSKVYPAMYIENVSELAFDDILPEDPDFQSIQGLAEAGLIASKLSRRDLQQNDKEDTSPFYFSPESPLSRQDLVTWRMALDKKQLPLVDKKRILGFIDIDKIDPDAWPALAADLATGEQGIVTLAFGYTRLFQPGKPVTKAQTAIALSTGDAYAIVSEELARIEAESMAENAVAAHTALVAQVENDLNESYEKELLREREKINVVAKLAEEAKQEVEKLRATREEENLSLMKERAAVDSEMEILSRLRREVEEQLQAVMADKLEISYEKERLNKLRRESEAENQEITRLQHELEIERKALSMAREWAEDEAKRAREQAKALDEARNLWKRQGIQVMVDKDLSDEAEAGVTWLGNGEQFSVEETVERAETLVEKIKRMAEEVGVRIKDTLSRIVEMIVLFISNLKKRAGEIQEAAKSKWDTSLQHLHDDSTAVILGAKENAKRISGDCKEGFERLTQRFKT